MFKPRWHQTFDVTESEMHPRLNLLIYMECGHLTFWPRQIFLFTFCVDAAVLRGERHHDRTFQDKKYLVIDQQYSRPGRIAGSYTGGGKQGLAVPTNQSAMQWYSGVNTTFHTNLGPFALWRSLSNHWENCLTWPLTVFLKGLSPDHDDPVIRKPCKHLCTRTLFRSQILHVPSHISCGLRHSWLSSIEKQKIAWYQENFYLSTHTTLRECSVDLNVGGVINKNPQVKRKWKQKKRSD